MVTNSVSLFLVIGITTSTSGPIYLPNEPPGNSHDLINSFRKMYFAKFYVSQGIVNKNFSFFFVLLLVILRNSSVQKFFLVVLNFVPVLFFYSRFEFV